MCPYHCYICKNHFEEYNVCDIGIPNVGTRNLNCLIIIIIHSPRGLYYHLVMETLISLCIPTSLFIRWMVVTLVPPIFKELPLETVLANPLKFQLT